MKLLHLSQAAQGRLESQICCYRCGPFFKASEEDNMFVICNTCSTRVQRRWKIYKQQILLELHTEYLLLISLPFSPLGVHKLQVMTFFIYKNLKLLIILTVSAMRSRWLSVININWKIHPCGLSLFWGNLETVSPLNVVFPKEGSKTFVF